MKDDIRYERIINTIDLVMSMQAATTGVSLKEIQEKYGISRRTAQRMKDVVLNLFPQAEEIVTNNKIKRWGFRGKTVNLYNFNSDEIADLSSIKELCKINNLSVKIPVLDKVIKSIKSANNSKLIGLENDLDALLETQSYIVRQCPSFIINETVLINIRNAIKSMKKLQFNYQSKDYYNIDENNLAGFRIQKGLKPKKTVVIEPYGILYGERHYLVAKEGEKIKQYLLHRISDIKVIDEYFTPDPNFNLKTWADTSFGVFHNKVINVKLKFKKEIADDVIKYNFHPTQKITQQKNGDIIVTFKSSGTKTILWNIFKWGTNVKILAPRELIENYREMLKTIIQIY